MTENKRFILDDAGELIDLNTHKFVDYGEECCNLLNEQHETIERLKQNIDELLTINVEEELLKENEQLKEEIQQCRDYNAKIYSNVAQNEIILSRENKQLKQRNKRLEYKIQRERNSFTKTHLRWSKEAENKIKELSEENERLRRCINEIYTIARLEEV